MAGARLLMLTDANWLGRAAPTWPGREGLIGERGTDGSWVAWRLLGGNNRELGRSAAVYPDQDSCRAAIDTLRRRLPEASVTVIADLDEALWRWRVEIDGVPLAVSSRMYSRQRECQFSITQFLAALPSVLEAEVHVSDAPRLPAHRLSRTTGRQSGRRPSTDPNVRG